MTEAVRRFRRLLMSRAAAVTVMGVMAGLLALSSLLPGADEGREPAAPKATWELLASVARNLGVAQVVASPLFLILPGFLFAAVALSIVQRVRLYRARLEAGLRAAGGERFRMERSFLLPGEPSSDVAARLAAELGRGRWDSRRSGSGRLEVARGTRGFHGSILFHVGLLLILGGVVLSARTRLHAEAILAEGFRLPFVRAALRDVRSPQPFQGLPGIELEMRDFVAEYSSAGTPVDFSAVLSVTENGVRRLEEIVRVNDPFHFRGYQLTLHRYGFAPDLVARAPDGRVVLDGVSVLQLLPPGREDSLPLEGGGALRVALYPDFATEWGRPGTRSLNPSRPVVAYTWTDDTGTDLAKGLVGKGETSTVAGRSVTFQALSYWGGFYVARDAGLWLFALGGLASSLGLALRLAYPDQSLVVETTACDGGTRVHIVARTRFFPALYEEQVERAVERVKESS